MTLDALRPDKLPLLKRSARILSNNVLFDQCITAGPYTLASLHAIYSGIYPHKNGVNGYLRPFRFKSNEIKTLTQYFSENGFYCHADVVNRHLLPHQGFNQITEYSSEEKIQQNHIELIKKVKHLPQPFFLYLHQPLLHNMFVKDVLKVYKSDDKRYYSSVTKNELRYENALIEIDEYLNAIFSYLEKTEMLEDTLLVIHSDHGASFGTRFGERAYGEFCYDETIKAFVCLVSPKRFKSVKVSSTVRLIDLMPTFLDLFGFAPSASHLKLQGDSLLPLVHGSDSGDRTAYVSTGGLGGPHPSPDKHNVFCVRENGWKLIYTSTPKHFELYDLTDNPQETKNRYNEEQEIAGSLTEKLKKEFQLLT